MPTEIPVIPTDARLIYPDHPPDYRDVLRKEMEKRKIPVSIGKTCPVKCTFCYEIDHSYRDTLEPGKTTQEDWNYILDYISKKPTRANENWVWGGNEYMEWTDLFLHPKAMEWLEDFLKYTDKSVTIFTVGYVHVPRIHQLAVQYPNRINFELSVITLHKDHRKALMPHAPSISHLMKVLEGPGVTSANFYSFDHHTMSVDAQTISRLNPHVILWMGCLTPLKGMKLTDLNLHDGPNVGDLSPLKGMPITTLSLGGDRVKRRCLRKPCAFTRRRCRIRPPFTPSRISPHS